MEDNPKISMSLESDMDKRLQMVTDIVTAYVQNNALGLSDVPKLMDLVYQQFEKLQHQTPEVLEDKPEPALPVSESVTDDYIYCLEDGLAFKSLRRHLRSRYNLTPDSYRAKWGLPTDYPMVAPNYAKQRSELAKKMGLGKAERRS